MMTRHDQELLEKQLRRIDAAPLSGVLMLVMAIVFLPGWLPAVFCLRIPISRRCDSRPIIFREQHPRSLPRRLCVSFILRARW